MCDNLINFISSLTMSKTLSRIIFVACFILSLLGTGNAQKPNIVLILTDDQDQEMESLAAMPKLTEFIAGKGVTFENSFVAAPLCCPSRSSILTGEYVHNHGTFNNSISGGCSSTEWQDGPEKTAFPVLLNEGGYNTFFAGKYLNMYGMSDVGGLEHIPPGWNSWIALRGNSVYYNYSLSVNGTEVFHGDDPQTDYLTNIIKEEGIKFFNSASADVPFFAMLSTPACHDPITPEPKYENSLNTSKIPEYPNFNIENKDKNWFVRLGEQPLADEVVTRIEDMYRNRLRTLLTVDDMVEAVIQTLERNGQLENTYIFFTADNGYHLGQLSLAKDKREPYEFDIKVPLMVRGPGIMEGVRIESMATNIDLAPTFLDLAEIPVPATMDGISLKNILLGVNGTSRERSVLIEHSGEGSDNVQPGCEYLGPNLAYCLPELDCKCQDSKNNTYSCVRTIGPNKNEIYCLWDDDEQFEEYYNIMADPYELTNSVNDLNVFYHRDLKASLQSLVHCSGQSCNINSDS